MPGSLSTPTWAPAPSDVISFHQLSPSAQDEFKRTCAEKKLCSSQFQDQAGEPREDFAVLFHLLRMSVNLKTVKDFYPNDPAGCDAVRAALIMALQKNSADRKAAKHQKKDTQLEKKRVRRKKHTLAVPPPRFSDNYDYVRLLLSISDEKSPLSTVLTSVLTAYDKQQAKKSVRSSAGLFREVLLTEMSGNACSTTSLAVTK